MEAVYLGYTLFELILVLGFGICGISSERIISKILWHSLALFWLIVAIYDFVKILTL